MSETIIINGPVVVVLPPPFEEAEPAANGAETSRAQGCTAPAGATVNLLESE